MDDKKFKKDDSVWWIDDHGDLRWGRFQSLNHEVAHIFIPFPESFPIQDGIYLSVPIFKCWATRDACLDAKFGKIPDDKATVKIENNNKYDVGDAVWWFDSWGNLRCGIIYRIQDDVAGIHEEGKTAIQTGAKLSKCWPSKDACVEAEVRRVKAQRKAYKESITDVKDLVKFLFEHDVISENPDNEARWAATERAKELLGLTIN